MKFSSFEISSYVGIGEAFWKMIVLNGKRRHIVRVESYILTYKSSTFLMFFDLWNLQPLTVCTNQQIWQSGTSNLASMPEVHPSIQRLR